VQGRLEPAEAAADDDHPGAISDTRSRPAGNGLVSALHECQETVYAAGLNW
jgi:hypothetical protein